jgi:uncharacterized protein (DUF362 family)
MIKGWQVSPIPRKKGISGNSVVSVAKTKEVAYTRINVEAMVREAIERLGGISKFVKSEQTVFIKPNAVVPSLAIEGVTVEPKIISSLIKVAKEVGATRVLVGDSSVNGSDTLTVMKELGITKAVQEEGGEIVSLDEVPLIETKVPQGKVLDAIKIPKPLIEADVIVDVAKAKTHYIDGISGCIKNWVGVIPQRYRLQYHQSRLSQVVAEIMRQIPPNLCVGDALVVGEGEGPNNVNPRFLGVIIAGTDPVATDVVIGNLMGFDVNELEFPWVASLEGLGVINPNKIKVLGPSLEEIRIHAQRPNPAIYNRFPCNIVLGGACPGCLTWIVGTSLDWLRDGTWNRILRKEKPTFMVGYNAQDTHFEKHLQDGPYFVIGDCAPEQYKRDKRVVFISGCCPGHDIPNKILKKIDLK